MQSSTAIDLYNYVSSLLPHHRHEGSTFDYGLFNYLRVEFANQSCSDNIEINSLIDQLDLAIDQSNANRFLELIEKSKKSAYLVGKIWQAVENWDNGEIPNTLI